MADKSRTDAANAQFKKAQRDQDAQKAMSEYDAEGVAVRAKTERLKALRLARDAAAPKPEPAAKKKAKTAKTAKTAKKAKTKSAKLSDWLDGEKKEGRRS
jgi:hypothetical protein